MNLYQDHILDHYHNPRNHGTLAHPSHTFCANNPTCGDKIHINLLVKNEIVIDVAFSGEGCAISQAATSILFEKIKNKPVALLKEMTKDDMLILLGVDLSPNRLKCALLGLDASHKALNHS